MLNRSIRPTIDPGTISLVGLATVDRTTVYEHIVSLVDLFDVDRIAVDPAALDQAAVDKAVVDQATVDLTIKSVDCGSQCHESQHH